MNISALLISYACRRWQALILIIASAFVATCASAYTGNAIEDYERLSRLSSEELMEQGRSFFADREAGKALSRFLIVGERFDAAGSSEERELAIRALNNAGCVYKYFYYDYPQAYDYFQRALSLCKETGYEEFLPTVMVNLADLLNDYAEIYNSESFGREAAELFDRCYAHAAATGDWELLTTAFFNLSNANYDIDLRKYRYILSDSIPPDAPDISFARLQYRGIESIQKGDYAAARKYFEDQTQSVSTNWEPERDVISSLVNIAKTYQLESDYTRAVEHLDKALALARNAGLIDLSGVIARELADTYLELGDSAAYTRLRMAYLENRELIHNNRLGNVAELKYISDLKAEEAKAREHAARNRIYLIVSLVLAALLITIIISSLLIWRKNRKLKSRNQSLFETYQRMVAAEEASAEETKYAHSNLGEEKRETLIGKIRECLDNPDIICNHDFSLKQLAELTGSNTTYVSQAINETFGVSFNTLLGNCRIRLVCHRLNETSIYDNYTVEGIGNSIGFKSRTAFLNAFKREVGLTPSEYIKMASKEKKLR